MAELVSARAADSIARGSNHDGGILYIMCPVSLHLGARSLSLSLSLSLSILLNSKILRQ
jgi:hypothetical protein